MATKVDVLKEVLANLSGKPKSEFKGRNICKILDQIDECGLGGGSGGGEQFFVPFEMSMDYFKIGEKQFDCTFDFMNDFYVMADDVFASFIDELNSKVVFSRTVMSVGVILAQIIIETNNGADDYCGGIMITFADESYRVYSQTGSTNAQ